FHMIARRPWTGYGLGTWSVVYPEFATFDTGLAVDHAHNDWAEWTAEGGIPVLAAMAALAILTFRRALDSRWSLGVHAVLIHSAVDFPLQIPALAFLLFTMLGVLIRVHSRSFAAKSTRLAASPSVLPR